MKILFKKILYTLVLSVGLISVSSCADYLDVSDEIADNLSLEDVFENKGYVQKWHANIFNSICAYEFMGGAGEENGFSGVWNLLSGEVTLFGLSSDAPGLSNIKLAQSDSKELGLNTEKSI